MRKNLWHFFLGIVFATNFLAVVVSLSIDRIDLMLAFNLFGMALAVAVAATDE